MLNQNLERQNEQRLMVKNEIPVKAGLTSPFENTDDIILSSDVHSAIVKNQVKIQPKYTTSTYQTEGVFAQNIKENKIKNAYRDWKKAPDNPYLLANLGMAYLRSGKSHSRSPY